MPEHDTHAATRTHYCRQPGCTNEARSDRGLYSKCDEHRAASPSGPRRTNGGGGTGLASQLAQVQQLARTADRLRAKAEKLTREALEAKREADDAAKVFRTAARAIIDPRQGHGDD